MPKVTKVFWRVRRVKYPRYSAAVAAAVDVALVTEQTVAIEHVVNGKVVEMVDIEARLSTDTE